MAYFKMYASEVLEYSGACLPGLHEYKDVDYVDISNNGFVMCDLCGTGWMWKKEIGQHFHGSRHKKRYNQLKNLKRDIVEKEMMINYGENVKSMQQYDVRVSQLGLAKWRWHLNDLRYQITSAISILKREEIEKTLKNTLLKYETMERVSLLELAIRNHYQLQKIECGYERQVSCGINVIITSVIRFLK